jgi:hypothetical protein
MFDPTRPANTVFISELSPRTGSATQKSSFDIDSAKLQPYAVLEEGTTPQSTDTGMKTANWFYRPREGASLSGHFDSRLF